MSSTAVVSASTPHPDAAVDKRAQHAPNPCNFPFFVPVKPWISSAPPRGSDSMRALAANTLSVTPLTSLVRKAPPRALNEPVQRAEKTKSCSLDYISCKFRIRHPYRRGW